jgi:hypothetical protein
MNIGKQLINLREAMGLSQFAGTLEGHVTAGLPRIILGQRP